MLFSWVWIYFLLLGDADLVFLFHCLCMYNMENGSPPLSFPTLSTNLASKCLLTKGFGRDWVRMSMQLCDCPYLKILASTFFFSLPSSSFPVWTSHIHFCSAYRDNISRGWSWWECNVFPVHPKQHFCWCFWCSLWTSRSYALWAFDELDNLH